MFPGFTLFGNFFVSSYALCALAGIFTACPLSIYYFKKRTKNKNDDIALIFVFLFAAIGTFIGMHLLYGLTNIEYWGKLTEASDFMDFLNRFGIIFGGSVFYGGLIGGLIAGGISAKVQKLSIKDVTDCGAPVAAVIHGFGRIGCFLGGCCYGVEWEYGITFHNSLVESANGVPRVPVQLFEAGFEFALGILLFILLSKRKLYGRLLCVYLLAYPVGRFIIEFWRGDDYRGFLGGLSTSQLISIGIFFGTLVFLIANLKKQKEDQRKAG
ncbi:MAG: prolipoprotein diacylglyceryl transferase [Oscillospiraceae bacterium]|nr:prolipoprotein diacylglyceryl transferase [Oscillospiraceae bacterium]